MTVIKYTLALVFCIIFTSVFSQTFNWNAYPTNAATWVASPTFSVTKATAGGGSFDVRSSAAAGNSPLSGAPGSTAQNCTTYNGLRLEMSGAGNGAGTAVWNNSITVTVNFPSYLCAPVTFNIYDITEAIYYSSPNYVYYQDKVLISALDNANNPVLPTATTSGPIDNVASGNTRVLTANVLNGQCINQAISVGTSGQQIKQITIVYCNQDIPTHCPAPAVSPYRYGISQYQYIFISPITGAAPPTASITSPTLACSVTSTTLTATTSASSPTYSWTGPGGSTVSSPSSSATAVSGAGVYTVVINPGGCSTTATYNIGSGGTPPSVTATAPTTLSCTNTTVQAIATTTSTPVTYTWTGPGITGGANTATASVNAPGTYNYSVTAAGGCVTTGTVAVSQNTSVVTASTTVSSSLNCTTTTAQIIATTTASPVSYVWTGTGITSGAGTATINVNQGGTFNYTITNTSNGCRTTGSQAVSQNTALPNPTATSPNSITCLTSTVALNGGPAALTYTWSGAGFSGGTNSQNAVATAAGTYTLAVTGTNGCTNTAVTTVGTNTALPSPTATSPNSITCLTSTVALNGGPAALTYTWSGAGFSGGTNSQNAVATVAGSYTLAVTGANGCTNTAVTTVGTNTTPPSATASLATAITCTSTSATLQGGPLSGVTYSWTGAGLTGATNQATATITAPGTYTLVTTSTVNGCTNTAVVTPTANLTSPQVSVVPDLTINCLTPTALLEGSSSTPGATYAWTGPVVGNPAGSTPTNSTSVVNAPGTYTLTVTNPVNACTSTAVLAVTSNVTLPSITVGSSQTVTCSSPSAVLTGSSTASPVNYSWTGPTSGNPAGSTPTNSNTTVNAGGTYTLVVTNPVNSCTNSAVVSITQNTTVPSASAIGGTLSCANTSTTLVGGPASGVNYSWSGVGLSGATNLANATATATGSYTLVTTSTTNGCTNTAVATVTNNTVTPTANAGSTQTLVCGVSSVTLTGAGTPLGSTANWLGGVVSPTSFTTTVGAPGTYTLVVTHPTSGCTSTSTVAVSSSTDVPQATVNAITNSITCTNSVVAIGVTLSNTDPVSYTWTGPGIAGTNNTASTTATVAGTYSVTITNTVSNCQSVFNVVVPTNTNNPVTTANSSNTITCSTTSITVSATPTGTNYGYAWSGPGTITNGTTANPGVNVGGTYTVTITDNVNGCIGTGTVNVATNTVSPTMTLTPSSLTTTCANPTATLLATSSADPDVNYVWTAPATGSLNNTTINNPVANGSGVFTVQVTNTVSGCVSATETVTITADANVPTLNATSSNTAICSNQTVTLSITGADTYTWSTTENTSTITVTPATTTTYSVSGTNTLTGCSNITNVTINVTPTPTLNVAASATTICEGNTTTLTLTGATSYTVTNPSQTTTGTITLSPTAQTTYTIVGDASGCATTTETITINVNALPTVAASNTITCSGSPVTLSATGADTYNWQPTGATTNTTSVSPTTNTTYTVTGTNTVTGCTSTLTTADVTVNQLPNITANANPNTTCTSGTVNLNAATTGTTAITNYTWTIGNGVDNTNQNQGSITFPASGLTTGTYTYTVVATDANGCVSLQATTTLDIIDTPNANFDLSDLSICQNENGTISINTPQTGVTYDWNINGQAITNTNPLTVPSTITSAAGTYTVNVIAGIGTCTNAAANTLTVNALPTISLVNPTVTECVNTTAQLDVAGPNATYTYNWTNGSNTSTGPNLNVNPLTQASAGSYTVTATDQNGCVNRTIGAIDAQECITEVPEIFTPNGDGKNDGFVIKNIENFPDNKLKIFNRWGNLVYEKNGYLNEFEGFANTGDQVGKSKLPSGTYYVVLEYGDQKTETYNGILVLQY
jgi:gliding motility-associated-like protein